ncbi:signal recognition particle protein [Neisseria gonorrhoeae]|uniref:Signal recognition particle protein n=1 Tax=Neisseria gonorrhoeae TaxID=485 RepID=A0A379B1E3_NEIGO|nr:signal recognition particle protein [Neisseria gonorrhoeae]
MRNMGGLENLMSKMPGELGQISKQIPEGTAEKAMGKVEAIINSMTLKNAPTLPCSKPAANAVLRWARARPCRK